MLLSSSGSGRSLLGLLHGLLLLGMGDGLRLLLGCLDQLLTLLSQTLLMLCHVLLLLVDALLFLQANCVLLLLLLIVPLLGIVGALWMKEGGIALETKRFQRT